MSKGEGAFEHKSRKSIYNYIKSNPGVSFGDIKRVFDMNTSTLKYHLHFLERADEVFSEREGRRRCYYCTRTRETTLETITNTRHETNTLTDTQEYLLRIIQDQPGISNKELINITKLNRQNINYNIKKLSELKLIWMVRNNGMIGYEYITNEKLRDEAINKLIIKLLSDEIDEETFKRVMKKLEELDLDKLLEN
jgi:predicted transcriptional regulator